jgi:hypothetical protein
MENILRKRLIRTKFYPVYDKGMKVLTVVTGSELDDQSDRYVPFRSKDGVYLCGTNMMIACEQLSKILGRYDGDATEIISNKEVVEEIVNLLNN